MSTYEAVKSSIRILLSSTSNGLTLEQLNTDYQLYNQSKNIPFTNFGYKTLVDFLSDMSDILLVDKNSSPVLVHAIKKNNQSNRKKLPSKSSTIDAHFSFQTNKKCEGSTLKVHKKFGNKNPSKTVKRLPLNSITNNLCQLNNSTESLIRQLTNLKINGKYLENSSQNELLTISINSTNQCQIVRYTNGKYYIPCFELSRILNLNENILDQETMFSRIRIYQSNDFFNKFKQMNNSCQHIINSNRCYFFLFLISSILPVLQMTNKFNQYHQIIFAFEQLLFLDIPLNNK